MHNKMLQNFLDEVRQGEQWSSIIHQSLCDQTNNMMNNITVVMAVHVYSMVHDHSSELPVLIMLLTISALCFCIRLWCAQAKVLYRNMVMAVDFFDNICGLVLSYTLSLAVRILTTYLTPVVPERMLNLIYIMRPLQFLIIYQFVVVFIQSALKPTPMPSKVLDIVVPKHV
mmetsp:Transcript_50398/g.126533  ORF Transcript_50398/g.126533 Transcript_50398/m.126533 type:complete len:171 (+) Transcript_50398:617-1129(+)